MIIMRKNAPHILGLALLLISSGALLSSCAVPEQQAADPGQALTWQQKHALDMQNYQELGDARRQDNRGCRFHNCM
jgi:outer membrane biogenesis lipoprotein LolB